MKPLLKFTIVAGGYLLAFLVAYAAVAIHTALTDNSAVQASAGMSAFGDLVLFAVVFMAAALLPTGALLFFVFAKRKPLHAMQPMPSAPSLPPAQESPPR